MKHISWAIAAVFVCALTACGGDDDDTPAATSQVPAAANDSVDNFVSYLQQLVVASADTLEPVDTSAVKPPVSDTTEPAVVN